MGSKGSGNIGLEAIGVRASEDIPYSIIENYIFDIKGLSANKKMFILMLRRYAGSKKDTAYPSYRELMDTIGCSSKTTIGRCIDFFVWLHWLERVPRTDKGEKVANLYVISLYNIKTVLDSLKKRGITMKEVEKYFDDNYYTIERISEDRGTKKINKAFLDKTCKFLIE